MFCPVFLLLGVLAALGNVPASVAHTCPKSAGLDTRKIQIGVSCPCLLISTQWTTIQTHTQSGIGQLTRPSFSVSARCLRLKSATFREARWPGKIQASHRHQMASAKLEPISWAIGTHLLIFWAGLLCLLALRPACNRAAMLATTPSTRKMMVPGQIGRPPYHCGTGSKETPQTTSPKTVAPTFQRNS